MTAFIDHKPNLEPVDSEGMHLPTKPMNLLFVSDAPTVGGSETYLREMLPRLQAKGHKVAVALPRLEGNRSIREQLQERGIWVHAYETLSEIPHNYDALILSAWFPQNHRKIRETLPGPHIGLIHDQILIYYPGVLKKVYQIGYGLIGAPNMRGCDHLITVSKWGAAHLERVHHLERVAAVPNGVDTVKFRPADSSEEREDLRQKLGFEGFTVLVPARVSIEKNHLAVLATARRCPQLQFVLVGGGELRPLLEPLSAPNVKWLGTRQDMPDLYRAADALLQPTWGENQSLATLEAMSSGLAVVSSHIEAQQELITDGLEGIVVPATPKNLAAALTRVAQDPTLQERLGKQGRAKVLKSHRIEQSAQRLETVLQGFLRT